MSGLSIFAPAKVNLHLAVGPVAPDGYHPVETVLQALALGDRITITEAESPVFGCDPSLGLAPAENLAWRAAEAMSDAFGRPLRVEVSVDKRVPHGAGLGGASSDAAAVIVGLAVLWGVGDDERLAEVGRSLGSDVPFFLTGGAALYRGRGDVLVRPVRPLDAAVVVVKPEEPVPTAAAYAAFDLRPVEMPATPDRLLAALDSGDVPGVAGSLFNAMTESSSGLVPAIAGALALVREHPGVLGAAMAGSGSAVFGVCDTDRAAEECAAAARLAGLWSASTRCLPAKCTIERI